MSVYRIDPISDPRWEEFVQKHPKASVFHTVGWLRALRRTYGYQPVVFTTSPPTCALKNGLVFCRVNSWLTGRRLVSLPFSDHCEPLCDSAEDLHFLIRYLRTALEHQKWKYLEVRPVNGDFTCPGARNDFLPAATYFLHKIDLRPDSKKLFHSFDKDCVQRRILRARRAGLVDRCGTSEDLLKEFYALFVATRSRHHVPPIPYAWFQNLIHFQSEAVEIRVAYKDKTPVAAILTLQFKEVVYYKYGCSDVRFNKYGGTPWLLWKAIEVAQSKGMTEFDMGRTHEGNAGLLAFKNHWVRRPRPLVYWNFPGTPTLDTASGWELRIAKHVFSWMPEKLLNIAGRVLYRHIG
jgi:Acetyltransferase (GNAT) domain